MSLTESISVPSRSNSAVRNRLERGRGEEYAMY